MRAPVGAEVGFYYDCVVQVEPGDCIRTQRGRLYGVTSVRVQSKGKHKGRQHLRAVVLADSHAEALHVKIEARLFTLYWHPRKRRHV